MDCDDVSESESEDEDAEEEETDQNVPEIARSIHNHKKFFKIECKKKKRNEL